MKRLFHFLGLSLVAMMMNSCYDDSALWDSLKEYEGELAQLKSLCTEINQNVSSLQNLITAVENGDMIKSVTPFTEGDKTGYLIEFLKTPSIKIYNGQQGATGAQGPQGPQGDKGDKGDPGQDVGSAPSLGVKQDTDGVYYWTLNGTWLLDDAGNKVKAVATDGNDGAQGPAGPAGPEGETGATGATGPQGPTGATGPQGPAGETGPQGPAGITPQLKIEDGYWYVSYDNGKEGTWQQLGKATGEDGKDASSSGDSIFASVREDATHVYFTLTDGTVFKLQKAAGSGLNIEFDLPQGVAVIPGTTLKIGYTITGGDENTIVRTVNTDYFIFTAVKPTDAASGYIYIWNDDDLEGDRNEVFDEDRFGDLTEGDVYDSMLSTLISVSDGRGNTILKSFNIVSGKIFSVSDAYLADAAACSVSATIQTNVLEGSYDVVIPAKAQPWLSYAPQTRSLRSDVLTFNVTANEGEKFRSAPVTLKNNMNQILESFVIVQRSEIAGDPVVFKDEKVKKVCTARYDSNADGVLTYEEIATVTDIEDLFLLEKNITSFDELEYFTSLTTIPDEAFADCEVLSSIKLPESVIYIGSSAFSNCLSLTSIELPEGVTGKRLYKYEGEYEGGEYEDNASSWFAGCSALKTVALPSTLTELPSNCFENCVSLEKVTIPEGVEGISSRCFYGCESLSAVIVGKPVRYVYERAFYGCKSLKAFDFSGLSTDYDDYYGNTILGEYSFVKSGLESVTIPETITRLSSSVFAGCENLSSVTLHDGITAIGYSAFGYVEDYDEFYACSSLKNIVLPKNLQTIGDHAFAGSALEGTMIEGTQLKALVIPAKVTDISYDAFAGSNVSAVKMLAVYPPQGSYDMFNEGTTVYVPAESVEAYRNADGWNRYTILPYEMMSMSLGLECEVTDGERFIYEDGEFMFTFPVRLAVTGDIAKFDNVEEFGYYVAPGVRGDSKVATKSSYYGVAYYPLSASGVQMDTLLHVRLYDIDYEVFENGEYVYELSAQVGAYVRLVDGTVVRYDNRNVDLVYDEKPSMSFVSATKDSFTLDVKGGFWIDGISSRVVGDGYFEFRYGDNLSDGYNIINYDVYAYESAFYAYVMCDTRYKHEEFSSTNYLRFSMGDELTCEVVDEIGSMSLTIRNFLDMPDGETYYTLSGQIRHIDNGTYGNFVLGDDSGEVYVYGLTASALEYGAKNDKSFPSLGLKAGDYLTICGTHSTYSGLPQVGGPAYYISHESYSGEYYPEVRDVDFYEFLYYSESSNTRLYRLTGVVTEIANATKGNLYMKDEDGNIVYVYGIRANAAADAGGNSFVDTGIKVGDTITIVGYKTEYNGAPQMKEAYLESMVSGGIDLSKYSISLSHFEDLGRSRYDGGWFGHASSVALTADAELIENVADYGIYFVSEMMPDSLQYYSWKEFELGDPVEGSVWYWTSAYEKDLVSFVAVSNLTVGPYVVTNSGETIRYDGQTRTFIYDNKPSIKFVDAQSAYQGEKEYEYYNYSYDDAGSVIDSTLVKENLHTYSDTLFYEANGTFWMSNSYYTHAETMSAEMDGNSNMYDYLGYLSVDANNWYLYWNNVAGATRASWNYEYILYGASDERFHVSDNYVKRTWNADNTCSYEIVNEAPIDPYLYYVPDATTKSARNYVEIPVARKVKSGTVAKMVASGSTLPPSFKRSTLAR